MQKQLSQSIVEQWVELVHGSFQVRDVWAELNILTPEGKNHLRVILQRLEAKGVVAKYGSDGRYRKMDSDLITINWEEADPSKTVPVTLPFGIHELCKVYPKSIVIVAGEKQSGKTAFLYECIQLNMDNFVVDLFNSETGPEQMKERFVPLGVPTPAPFNSYERYDNYADVINPEHLTIIDYLDFNSEYYMVGAEIDAIFRKLTTGVAIIGLQKPPPTVTLLRGKRVSYSRDLAYGGGQSAKRAILYVSLGGHKLKLVYVKTPADPKVNPQNMMWSYSFNGGGYFTNIQRYTPEPVEGLE